MYRDAENNEIKKKPPREPTPTPRGSSIPTPTQTSHKSTYWPEAHRPPAEEEHAGGSRAHHTRSGIHGAGDENRKTFLGTVMAEDALQE
ncbi:hypothetical protein RRG08_060430 [Elysia crispata]|uniref:Uncharacterized protein n=1 Tax=Elysia crispata TaxID=231223 RepID=A0AAE1ALB2_9GAST|nr:hypothetical protein RRG08_060430 [Elysia crispata]